METEPELSFAHKSSRSIIGDMGVSLGIVFLAFLTRYEYLTQIRNIPLFSNLVADSLVYDQWGRAIAAGDWLGTGVFYQAPLYPYFLGLVYAIFGHDFWIVRVVQIVLGALSCGLLYLGGSKYFSRPVAVAAGLILCFYAPAIFYEGLIQKSVVDLFLVSLLLVVLGSSLLTSGSSKCFGAGAIVGLLALSRENAMVWVPVLAIWIYWYFTSFGATTRLVLGGVVYSWGAPYRSSGGYS